jgi:hypothetical protein
LIDVPERTGKLFTEVSMKKKTFLIKLLPITLVMGLALTGCGEQPQSSNSASGPNEPLFVDASNEALSMAQTTSSSEEPSVKKRYVKINFNVLKRLVASAPYGDHIPVFSVMNLNLFNDDNIQVVLEEAEKLSDTNYVFTGQVMGDLDSAVTVVVNDGILVANIRKGGSTQSYEVRNAQDDIHTVSLKNDIPDGDCPAVVDPDGGNSAQDLTADGDNSAQSTPVVDILAAYTPNARIQRGGTTGIKSLIQLGIADTNRALSDSGINLQVRLVGTMELRRNETGNWSNDLSYLKGKTDGIWDEVHAERARLGADQVSVVATYGGSTSSTAGIGYIRASYSSAFTVVRTSAFSQYTFSHELGHNLGLNHSDGYVNTSGRFRTIIAYGTYTRIRRYSNPSLSYNGYRTGDSLHNESRIINSYGATVASFLAPRVTAEIPTNLQ